MLSPFFVFLKHKHTHIYIYTHTFITLVLNFLELQVFVHDRRANLDGIYLEQQEK